MRGYFGIGIYRGKSTHNIGTLWRSAGQLGASFIFTVGQRYKHQASDTCKTWRHVPLIEVATMEELLAMLPYSCRIVGVEMGGKPLAQFSHPERALYLLGAEDHGLPATVTAQCHSVVSLESVRTESYNVAVAGSLVMYDRFRQMSPAVKVA
jgi:tRNA G18 (ribose-2'-O)-methylase SpoU